MQTTKKWGAFFRVGGMGVGLLAWLWPWAGVSEQSQPSRPIAVAGWTVAEGVSVPDDLATALTRRIVIAFRTVAEKVLDLTTAKNLPVLPATLEDPACCRDDLWAFRRSTAADRLVGGRLIAADGKRFQFRVVVLDLGSLRVLTDETLSVRADRALDAVPERVVQLALRAAPARPAPTGRPEASQAVLSSPADAAAAPETPGDRPLAGQDRTPPGPEWLAVAALTCVQPAAGASASLFLRAAKAAKGTEGAEPPGPKPTGIGPQEAVDTEPGVVLARHELALRSVAAGSSSAATVTATLTFYEADEGMRMHLRLTPAQSVHFVGRTGPRQVAVDLPRTQLAQARDIPVNRQGLIEVQARNLKGRVRLTFKLTPAGRWELLGAKEESALLARLYKGGGLPPLTGAEGVPPRVRKTQVGLASWYGSRFQGRRTASGERFDMHANTAAHRTLPLGTQARVTNLRNGKSAIVRINDRGPFGRGRIIDVSRGVAQRLGFRGRGTARVKVEVLDKK